MSIKLGENPNDDVNQTVETSVNAGMNEQDMAALDKISKLQDSQLQLSGDTERAKIEVFRLQFGCHGGSNVFFNRNGKDCRYSLIDGIHGSMYVARAPDTAMKEVFQHKKGLRESELDNYMMGSIVIERDIRILSVSKLIKRSNLTLHDVTTSNRAVTQYLAKKVHSAGFDGMEFLSNVTGDPCLVLWHNDPAGTGLATTRSQTSLSQFEYQDKEAADILVYDLGIPVEE
ncbi:RES family NAD+ phosphorylase [Edwardsiella tarda]|uniref:RES family NAD+ phosphorylase n=1 Tax=Edwardsiella tarda ATCC 15947 = NBRC 105688 TaxID=667121 RepID=A0AC61TMS4_EDWTA|nr:RES family NAD+ phosphorylase [Edwardsiella tarda]UAL58130.1 RES family NAD+ phosphorylase [Edwardsiella tarda]UCQ02011.1 RES family NAD+ phosphorylase [Edwardsiella tarda ATCC 15947 = NBRC 105688]